MGVAVRYAAWTGGGLLLAAAFLLFDAGTATGGPPRWMAIWALAGCALIWLACKRKIQVDIFDGVALAFLGWAALSLLWSGDPKAGLLHWQHMAALFAVAWLFRYSKILDPIIAPLLAGSIMAAVALDVVTGWDWFITFIAALGMPEQAVLYISRIDDAHGGFGNENFIAEFIVIATALMISVRYERVWIERLVSVAVVVAVGYLAFFNGSHVQYAAAVGLGAVAVWWCARRQHWVMFYLVFVVGGLLGGWMLATGSAAPIIQSFTERAEIWINTGSMIIHNPLAGVGLGAFDYAYPRVEHSALIGPGTFLSSPTDFMGAAHNDWLQLVAELGVIGMAISGALIYWTVKYGNRDLLVPLFFVGVLALVGFPLQNPMTALLVALSAGMAVRGVIYPVRSTRVARLGGLLVIPLTVSASLFYWSVMQARDIHVALRLSPVHALNSQLAALKTYDLDPWLRLQSTLTLASVLRTYPPDRVELEPAAADEIYRTALSAAPKMPGVLITRAEYLINSGRWRDSDEIEQVMADLRRYGPWYPETWALEAVVASLGGDVPRAELGVAAALNLPGGRAVFQRMGMLKTETEL